MRAHIRVNLVNGDAVNGKTKFYNEEELTYLKRFMREVFKGSDEWEIDIETPDGFAFFPLKSVLYVEVIRES